jgi:hypothetical protein
MFVGEQVKLFGLLGVGSVVHPPQFTGSTLSSVHELPQYVAFGPQEQTPWLHVEWVASEHWLHWLPEAPHPVVVGVWLAYDTHVPKAPSTASTVQHPINPQESLSQTQ